MIQICFGYNLRPQIHHQEIHLGSLHYYKKFEFFYSFSYCLNLIVRSKTNEIHDYSNYPLNNNPIVIDSMAY